jgi:hypothetical protein
VFIKAPWWTATCPSGWLPRINYQTTSLTCVNLSFLQENGYTNSSGEFQLDTNVTGLVGQSSTLYPPTFVIDPPLVLDYTVSNCGTFHVSNFTVDVFSFNYSLPASVHVLYHFNYLTEHYLFPNNTEYVEQTSQCALRIDAVTKA